KLSIVASVIYVVAGFSTTLVYWSRPRSNQSHVKSIEFNIVAVTALYYMDTTYSITVPMRWFDIELTWTSPIAITSIQVVRTYVPAYFCFGGWFFLSH